MTTLLDAVDALTLRWSIDVRDPDGTLIKRISHKPRLDMLNDAVAKSTSMGGGTNLARERSLIDAHAAEMYQRIRARINEAAQLLDVRAGEPIPTLRAWYAATLTKTVPDQWADDWTATLTTWANDIDNKLNPPESTIVTVACPTCQATFWHDPEQDHSPVRWPLRAHYWESGQHGIETAEASCLACGQRWVGIHAVKQLAYDIGHADADADEAIG